MNRILPPLAVFVLLFLGATFALGVSVGDPKQLLEEGAQRTFQLHRLAGVMSTLCVMLVESILITYFVGTSRWCKEVVETYKLDKEFVLRSNRCKRRTFPIAVIGMLIMVGIVGLGAMSDPYARMRVQEVWGVAWHQFHFFAAALGSMLIGYGFFLTWKNVVNNQKVIQEVLTEVKRIRKEKGLDTE